MRRVAAAVRHPAARIQVVTRSIWRALIASVSGNTKGSASGIVVVPWCRIARQTDIRLRFPTMSAPDIPLARPIRVRSLPISRATSARFPRSRPRAGRVARGPLPRALPHPRSGAPRPRSAAAPAGVIARALRRRRPRTCEVSRAAVCAHSNASFLIDLISRSRNATTLRASWPLDG